MPDEYNVTAAPRFDVGDVSRPDSLGATPLPPPPPVDPDDRAAETPFYNYRPAYHRMLREKPEHRTIAALKAQGHTHKDIAKIIGCTPQTVSTVLRQPWVVQFLDEETRNAGRDAISDMLHVMAPDAVHVLYDLMMDEAQKPEVRSKNACTILQHGHGMPVQKVQTQNVNLESLTDEELAKIAARGRSN